LLALDGNEAEDTYRTIAIALVLKLKAAGKLSNSVVEELLAALK
jgi:hypothetical protein